MSHWTFRSHDLLQINTLSCLDVMIKSFIFLLFFRLAVRDVFGCNIISSDFGQTGCFSYFSEMF